MSPRRIDPGKPDRLYTVTSGRSSTDGSRVDLVTLIVSECDPAPGMQSEHAAILRMCRHPKAVAEIAADLGLPVGVVQILLRDLVDMGRVSARNPSPVPGRKPDSATLERVLDGLRQL